MYAFLFRLLAKWTDAETVHRVTTVGLRLALASSHVCSIVQRLVVPLDERLRVDVLGHSFDSPLGLAAGFDKEGLAFRQLGSLGFSFVEVGTITAQAQPGNPRPRVFRLPKDRALINRMGFPNPGAEVAAGRLRRRGTGPIVGVNIGKTKVVVAEHAAQDYFDTARALAPAVDYLVVNVSSPNTPGLRLFETEDGLRQLLEAVRNALEGLARPPALLVKVSPEVADAQLDAIVDLCLEQSVDGIVAVNTSTSRDGLSSSRTEVLAAGSGGVSGVPLQHRALEVLQRIRGRAGDRLVIISVGGVDTAEEAWCRLRAGATLVQAYTGFVYGGPLWPSRTRRRLSELLDESGLATVTEVIGIDADPARVP
jgi:dihydroorotate dehydrogenase